MAERSDAFEALVHRLNTHWQAAQWDALSLLYHPKAVLVPPDVTPVITGRDAIVATYEEFADAATLHDFKTGAIRSYRFDTSAVVEADFTVDYSVQGERYLDEGHETYVLERAATPVGYHIVWRQQYVHLSRRVEPTGAGP
ncbi:MAG: nuclear transport factor 2 family protein [Pseudomonadota bacterium]